MQCRGVGFALGRVENHGFVFVAAALGAVGGGLHGQGLQWGVPGGVGGVVWGAAAGEGDQGGEQGEEVDGVQLGFRL